jgi:hypothetical protein
MEMAGLICGRDSKLKIAQIPISNGIIHDRIKEMSQDIQTQVVEKIRGSPERNSCSWMN